MKTRNVNVKDVLINHNPREIVKELNDCEKILSAYNHFLASYQAQLYCNAKDEVLANKAIIQVTINELKKTLLSFDTGVQVITKHPNIIYNHSALEMAAIMNFNSDNRFTITE